MTYLNWQLIESCLRQLGDTDYRRRLWLGMFAGRQGSFKECYEMLFGDSGLSEALERGDVGSEALEQDFKKLGEMLGAIYDSHGPTPSPSLILADPRMNDVAEVAQHLLATIETA